MPRAPAILTEAEWSRVAWVPTDLRRDEDLKRLFAERGPDLVIHLAGISHVPDAEGAPAVAYDINVIGAVRLLTSAVAWRRKTGRDPLILTSLLLGARSSLATRAGTVNANYSTGWRYNVFLRHDFNSCPSNQGVDKRMKSLSLTIAPAALRW